MNNTVLVTFPIDVGRLIEFNQFTKRPWGNDPFNPYDTTPFVDLPTILYQFSQRNIAPVNPLYVDIVGNVNYEVNLKLLGTNISLINANIVFSILDLTYYTWDNIFETNNINVSINPQSNLLNLSFTSPGSSETERKTNIHTVNDLIFKGDAPLSFTINFSFLDNIGITRYCKIDPLIRTNSKQDNNNG